MPKEEWSNKAEEGAKDNKREELKDNRGISYESREKNLIGEIQRLSLEIITHPNDRSYKDLLFLESVVKELRILKYAKHETGEVGEKWKDKYYMEYVKKDTNETPETPRKDL
jgi:hypothetical protein